jgi:hypothetical protein
VSARIRRVRNLVRTRTCSPQRVLFGRQVQAIASSSVGTVETARRELDHGKRAQGDLYAPRTQRLSDAKHSALAIDEGNVDRELHEECVNTATGRENQGVVVGEARASEKTPVPGGRVERRLDSPGDDASVARVA